MTINLILAVRRASTRIGVRWASTRIGSLFITIVVVRSGIAIVLVRSIVIHLVHLFLIHQRPCIQDIMVNDRLRMQAWLTSKTWVVDGLSGIRLVVWLVGGRMMVLL